MKKVRILLIAVLIILASVFFSNTYAVTRTIGAQEVRPFTNLTYKFRAGANGTDKVYTVVKPYDDTDRNEQNTLIYSKAIYCLRGGLGFGADDETDVSNNPIEYTEFGEMHENATSVIAKYEEYYNVNLNREETINQKQVNIYNAILWILDESYLPVDKTNYDASEYKTELLLKAGIPKLIHGDITDDDLEVIQQLAIWYFTNYDEQIGENLQSVSQSTKFPAQFLSINDNNNLETRREESLNKIYQYFIYGAIDNSNIYKTTPETESKSKYIGENKFDKTLQLQITSVDYVETNPNIVHPELYYYDIGPFKIKTDINGTNADTIDLSSIVVYDANDNPISRFYEIEAGGFNKVYSFIDAEGQEVTELHKGIEYYIRFKKLFDVDFELGEESPIPEEKKYDMNKVTLELSSVYSMSSATFLIRENADQPLVEINKEKLHENDKITTEVFDLALRKFITSIKRDGENITFDARTPKIDTTTLINGTFERGGRILEEHTATYTHSKEPLIVKQGDIVTYTLRIYNEGDRAGYATEITDYIPEGLALILNHKTNYDNGWRLQGESEDIQLMNLVGENGFYKTVEEIENFELDDFEEIEAFEDVELATGKIVITSEMLKEELINPFDKDKTLVEEGWQKADEGDGGLYYKDIQISCLVVAENSCKDILTNIAEISNDKDENGDDVVDRDSTPDNLSEDDINRYQNKEDDDDYEPVVLKYFDLALRKFITGVETKGETKEITSRIPKLTKEKNKDIVYNHTKEPVYVANNDTVIYTIRVYNEGNTEGYVEEITDDIPEGLEFLPEHNVNKNYEWVMRDKNDEVTEKIEEAVKITTAYLSEAKRDEDRDNLIKAFNINKQISETGELNPDYKDVKVAFKVTEPNTSDRIIINSAQISEDSDDDEDSIPNEWNEGEDDQDKEYIYVKYFDLSLLKWVTQTIVTVDDKTTTTETGFKPNTGKTETTGIRDNSESEPIAKVEIDRKKLNKTTVKFAYSIRVTNEGEIEGYATEITDYIPQGLEFAEEDNKAFGWTKEGEDKITTRALETVLLKPGESAEIQVIFTWKKDTNNLGLKTNIAEISEDYNENDSKDIDSTPDNKNNPYEKEQEDDDDFALVILTIKTGKGASYTIFITLILTVLASGMYLIKKYVLEY